MSKPAFEHTSRLTHDGVLRMLSAGVAKADEIGQPQCIVIVDASGELLAEIRMTGAKFLSRKTAAAKAMTSASHGIASAEIPESVATYVGLASDGHVTHLPGGLPVLKDGRCLGGIGVGSGAPDQDLAVARAALSAIDAEPQ
ncbi:MAG: heme-binding protein [Pseudomonadota bacterium]